jgi:hypothetical protein
MSNFWEQRRAEHDSYSNNFDYVRAQINNLTTGDLANQVGWGMATLAGVATTCYEFFGVFDGGLPRFIGSYALYKTAQLGLRHEFSEQAHELREFDTAIHNIVDPGSEG